MDVEIRFWAKVRKTDTCWLWTGYVQSNGYGKFVIWKVGTFYAHRLAYALSTGDSIPEGMDLDHLCRVRHCVNPAHLEIVTRRTNLLRGKTVTAQHAARTTCPRGHPYDGVKPKKKGGVSRFCRQCRYETFKRWHLEHPTKAQEYERRRLPRSRASTGSLAN